MFYYLFIFLFIFIFFQNCFMIQYPPVCRYAFCIWIRSNVYKLLLKHACIHVLYCRKLCNWKPLAVSTFIIKKVSLWYFPQSCLTWRGPWEPVRGLWGAWESCPLLGRRWRRPGGQHSPAQGHKVEQFSTLAILKVQIVGPFTLLHSCMHSLELLFVLKKTKSLKISV